MQTNQFINSLSESISQNTFVKLSLGNYKGSEEGLKNIYVKQILIKREEKLNFTYRYKTRDITKNFTIEEGVNLIHQSLENGFKVATLFTNEFDLIWEQFNNQKITLRKINPTQKAQVSLDHDRSKKRLIETNAKAYLHELKITDAEGNVYKNAQDKYKQINHYVDILSSLIKEIPAENLKKVVDMGSGKGYLTFALYDYLTNVLALKPSVIGVEFRPDMVELCNSIAQNTGFDGLNFVEGTIENYDSTDTYILIALHACDTATDDAIYKGITAEADLIVVAPCCHKQIRREIEKNKASNELDFLTKYGIFLERQAEMVTDGIRAMILEYFGYKTKVFQFISDAHTPKNVLVVGIKGKVNPKKQAEILEKLKATKAYFGIDYHHLERLLALI
ncbi:SAM-dependent methyltransferase [Arcicella sp. LKC2W]|uniref:class I SAM-dependent methyltransferase n=1 Tax=Arcicella sp. LKC2W TaxID=2984198 RepID=UPI002B2022EF|nr:SAM-dependent methyltransferase [Arcicella sp. LKC2W]MEA5458775.1 SAM-dependent methyltransferase [Arcicella sp. LKC2W]